MLDLTPPRRRLWVELTLVGVGVLIIALMLPVWWSFASVYPHAAAAMTAANAPVPTMSTAPSTTAPSPKVTVHVPTPSYAAPTRFTGIGTREPELPPDQAAWSIVPTDTESAPDTTAGARRESRATAGTSSGSADSNRESADDRSAPAPGPIVESAALRCTVHGTNVTATLKIRSRRRVPVEVRAADKTIRVSSVGYKTVKATAKVAQPENATCSAVVAGRRIGPFTAS